MVATLLAVVNIYVGDLAFSPFSLERWQCIGIVALLFILVSLLLDTFASLTEIKKFTDGLSGNIKICIMEKSIYQSIERPCLDGHHDLRHNKCPGPVRIL